MPELTEEKLREILEREPRSTKGPLDWHTAHFGGAVVKDEFDNVVARFPEIPFMERGLRVPNEDAWLYANVRPIIAPLILELLAARKTIAAIGDAISHRNRELSEHRPLDVVDAEFFETVRRIYVGATTSKESK